MALRKIEEEVILLKAVKEIIDSIVNFEVLELSGSDPDSQISFRSITHQSFFNIVLVDFLSQTDKRSPVNQTTYLSGLKAITKSPCFNPKNSVALLKESTLKFVEWLEQEVKIQTWLPSIEIEAVLEMPRIMFLKMCGNISKHNFLRNVGVAEDLKNILVKSGVSIGLDDVLLALSNFHERFHTDIFDYQEVQLLSF